MAYLTPYENLRGFASSRPPLVVFMICMGLFAIVLLSLAYYVKWNEIRNPDISQVRYINIASKYKLQLSVMHRMQILTVGQQSIVFESAFGLFMRLIVLNKGK